MKKCLFQVFNILKCYVSILAKSSVLKQSTEVNVYTYAIHHVFIYLVSIVIKTLGTIGGKKFLG
jgi:hypothetical protein